MRFLGLDLGQKSLGTALSDESGIIALSYRLIKFDTCNYEVLLPQIKQIVDEYNVSKIVLGLPKNMNNTIGPRGEETIKFKETLEQYLNLEIILQDERLTTVEATNYLIEANMSRKKRKDKVDNLSATIILQTYLDRREK